MAPVPRSSPVSLAVSDNSGYTVGRSKLVWALWYFLGAPLVRSYFLPFSGLKIWMLRLFGARIGSGVYLRPGIKVKFPWRLRIGDYSWVGEDVWIDNMAEVTIGSNACVSQGSYICTGNHNWSSRNMKLFTKPVHIEDGAWVAANSTVCPGVTIGQAAILTVSSVAGKSIPPFQIWSGSPAVYVRDRIFEKSVGPEENTPLSSRISKFYPKYPLRLLITVAIRSVTGLRPPCLTKVYPSNSS